VGWAMPSRRAAAAKQIKAGLQRPTA
jgi:hypothetical protein